MIYAATTGPPGALSAWGEPVGDVANADSTAEIDLDVSCPAKYFLIWFNKAAPARDQEGRYQVEISDIKLLN